MLCQFVSISRATWNLLGHSPFLTSTNVHPSNEAASLRNEYDSYLYGSGEIFTAIRRRVGHEGGQPHSARRGGNSGDWRGESWMTPARTKGSRPCV